MKAISTASTMTRLPNSGRPTKAPARRAGQASPGRPISIGLKRERAELDKKLQQKRSEQEARHKRELADARAKDRR
jgi:hypothetical protein